MRGEVRCFFCLRKVDSRSAFVVEVDTELRLAIRVYACERCAKVRTGVRPG